MKKILAFKEKLGLYCGLCMAGLFLYTNQLKFWSDSELWPVAASRYLFSERNEYFFGVKPLFHFYLWMNSLLAETVSLHPIVTARLLSGLNSIFILVLCDQILKAKNFSLIGRGFFFLLMMSTSTWIFRSGEVRSDLFVTSIVLLALWIFQNPERGRLKNIFIIVLFVVSLLVTAKAFFWWLCTFPLWKKELKHLKFKTLFWIPLLFVWGAWLFFGVLIESSLSYFWNSFHEVQMGHAFFSTTRMEHIFRFGVQNLHVVFFLLGALMLGVRKSRLPEWWSLIFFLVFCLLFPDPLPHFLSALLPIVCLLALINFELVLKTGRGFRFLGWGMAVVAFLFIGVFGYRLSQLRNHNNSLQNLVRQELQNQIEDRRILVYDAAGLLIGDNVDHWFLGPAMGENVQGTLNAILNLKPDVIVGYQKLEYLGPNFYKFLEENYVLIGKSIYVRALKVRGWADGRNCPVKLEELKAHFPSQFAHKSPLYLRVIDGSIDSVFEVGSISETLCEVAIDTSTPTVATYFTSFAFAKFPRENLYALFAYDSYF